MMNARRPSLVDRDSLGWFRTKKVGNGCGIIILQQSREIRLNSKVGTLVLPLFPLTHLPFQLRPLFVTLAILDGSLCSFHAET